MCDAWLERFREVLLDKKAELEQRLTRIAENHRRPLDRDSKERAAELENHEVVDALGNEACMELRQIFAALKRIETKEYGICYDCRGPIREARLLAYPQADRCIDCANADQPNDSSLGAAG